MTIVQLFKSSSIELLSRSKNRLIHGRHATLKFEEFSQDDDDGSDDLTPSMFFEPNREPTLAFTNGGALGVTYRNKEDERLPTKTVLASKIWRE